MYALKQLNQKQSINIELRGNFVIFEADGVR